MNTFEVKVNGKVTVEQHEDKIVVLFENEKPKQEPKLKEGEWVRNKVDGRVGELIVLSNYVATVRDEDITYSVSVANLEPYTPKDGEYFYCEDRYSFVCVKKDEEYITSNYIGLLLNNKDLLGEGFCMHDSEIKVLRPATPEEIKMLDDALAKEGKRWDAEAKKLIELPKHKEPKVGELAIFWDYDKSDAMIGELLSFEDGSTYESASCWWVNAILFESMEQYLKFKKEE